MYLRLLWLHLTYRRRPRLRLWEDARTPMRVGLTDLDLLRHVNNGTYLTMMDLGRMDLMLRSGTWGLLKKAGWYPVVAGQTITYRRSLQLGQRFDLHTRILGIDGNWSYLEQTFAVGTTVHARAVVRARFLKRSGGTVSAAELEELLGGFPDHLDVPEHLRTWTATSAATEREIDADRGR